MVDKLLRKNKDGNNTTDARIGKGGRHRDDDIYSAVSYDLEIVADDFSCLLKHGVFFT